MIRAAVSHGLLGLLGLAGVLCACSSNSASPGGKGDAGNEGVDGSTSDATSDAPADPYAAECANAQTPPDALECTGLYTDLVAKTLSANIHSFEPAVPLWADFAGKNRYIWLPPGTKIDASDPKEWVFPVGTKVWKEFTRDDKRIETRFFTKVAAGYWVHTTYAWNADETAAASSRGGDIPLDDGGTYHIPTPDECDQCHRGRNENVLGFEQVSLGLSGAKGMTLAELVAENLITPAPAQTHLTIGDDGTGMAAGSLAWIHINCGVSCHNENSNALAYSAGMHFRLDPALLDGRPSTNFETRTTTLDKPATTPTWSGQPRIIPGDPTHSLLYKLITNRGTNNPVDNQMPPIATRIVDVTDTDAVRAWIAAMPGAPSDAGPEASIPDAAADAAPEASTPDGGPDAGPADAAAAD